MKKFLLASAMAVGLVSATMGEDQPKNDGGTAVFCPKCETVWVKTARNVGKTTVYVKTKKMECPDCKTAVQNFFSGGKFEHTCGKCGTLVACQETVKADEKATDAAPSEHSKAADGAHQHHQVHPKN